MPIVSTKTIGGREFINFCGKFLVDSADIRSVVPGSEAGGLVVWVDPADDKLKTAYNNALFPIPFTGEEARAILDWMNEPSVTHGGSAEKPFIKKHCRRDDIKGLSLTEFCSGLMHEPDVWHEINKDLLIELARNDGFGLGSEPLVEFVQGKLRPLGCQLIWKGLGNTERLLVAAPYNKGDYSKDRHAWVDCQTFEKIQEDVKKLREQQEAVEDERKAFHIAWLKSVGNTPVPSAPEPYPLPAKQPVTRYYTNEDVAELTIEQLCSKVPSGSIDNYHIDRTNVILMAQNDGYCQKDGPLEPFVEERVRKAGCSFVWTRDLGNLVIARREIPPQPTVPPELEGADEKIRILEELLWTGVEGMELFPTFELFVASPRKSGIIQRLDADLNREDIKTLAKDAGYTHYYHTRGMVHFLAKP